MEALGLPLRAEASLAVLTADVVKSSAIEGEHLNPSEVRSSIARQLGMDQAGLPRPSRAVDGVVEMMLDATQNFRAPLTEERLFAWHRALFPAGQSGMRRITVGGWRTPAVGAMQVVSGPVGRERVHFEAPKAERVPAEMAQFLEWFKHAVDVDPVLRAGVAHLWFVTIHPFEDGNGRTARAIADMCLAHADQSEQRFYSMSAQIEAERNGYYQRLEAAQRGSMDITAWLRWFLECLERALDNAGHTLAEVLRKARVWNAVNELSEGQRPVSDRQRLVISRLLDGFEGPLTSTKYAKLTKCSPDTALRDIHDLLARGILAQQPSGGRSTRYALAEPPVTHPPAARPTE